jgi:amino acid transporter
VGLAGSCNGLAPHSAPRSSSPRSTAHASYFGAEVVAVAAAESKNPGRSIPRSIRQVYIRIFIFYVLGTFIIGLNCPSNDPRLGTTSDATASPFVIAISRAGIKVLPHIISE